MLKSTNTRKQVTISHKQGALKVVSNKSLIRQSPLKNLLNDLQKSFSVLQNYDLAPFVHWKGNSTSSIHRWLRYREAYSPELIDKLNLHGRILDPFSGCGSIMVGAAQRGLSSTGVDINPLSTFSTAVKLDKLNRTELDQVRKIQKDLKSIIVKAGTSQLPDLSISEKVFEPDILNVVLKSKSVIDKLTLDNPKVGNFVKLAWLESLEKIGSYFKEGNGIKYRNKQRSIGKYKDKIDGEWQSKRFGNDQTSFAIDCLKTQLGFMIEDTCEWKCGAWSKQEVLLGSALELDDLIPKKKYDSIIFSPPYANRFDYFEAFKVELWFGGFVNSYAELNRLRKKSLRSHLAAEYRTNNPVFEELESLINMMDQTASSWRMGVPDLLRGYFQDMHTVLKNCRTLAPNGRTHVVVGNSAFAGVIIPTDVLTAMIGIRSGFSTVKIIESRHLTVSPQQRAILSGFEGFMRESVVVFE